PRTLLLAADARVDDQTRPADGELESERAVVALGRRATAIEQHDVTGLAGQHVEAAPAERAWLDVRRAARQVCVRPTARVTEQEERPDAREIARRGHLRLVDHRRRGGQKLARGPRDAGR